MQQRSTSRPLLTINKVVRLMLCVLYDFVYSVIPNNTVCISIIKMWYAATGSLNTTFLEFCLSVIIECYVLIWVINLVILYTVTLINTTELQFIAIPIA